MRLLLIVLTSTVAALAQTAQYTTFGAGCAGTMPVATLTPVALPVLGQSLYIRIDHLPTSAAVLFTGLSNTTSTLGALPVSLSGYGMPGCMLRVSPDSTRLVLGVWNMAAVSTAIPLLPSLLGLGLFQQAAVLDPTANVAGMVASDAASAVIGYFGLPMGGTPIANMVMIAPGAFLMGSTLGHPVEVPVHTVHLTRPFWMGRYEVTQAEYQAVMSAVPGANANPSYHQGASLPVESVSWPDAMTYCATLTAQERAANRLPAGYQYRLPTEAEWEYCCRAGTTTEWNTGTSLACSQANFSPGILTPCVPPGPQTAVVGSYAPNAWGLYDMHGNVLEWCLDGWDGTANFPSGPSADPYVTVGVERIFRGGSYTNRANDSRSASRDSRIPPAAGTSTGFRIVLASTLVP